MMNASSTILAHSQSPFSKIFVISITTIITGFWYHISIVENVVSWLYLEREEGIRSIRFPEGIQKSIVSEERRKKRGWKWRKHKMGERLPEENEGPSNDTCATVCCPDVRCFVTITYSLIGWRGSKVALTLSINFPSLFSTRRNYKWCEALSYANILCRIILW